MSTRLSFKAWQALSSEERQTITRNTIKFLIDIMKYDGYRLIEAENKAKQELGIGTNVMADITTTKEFKTQYAQIKTYKRNAQSL